ncbi:site-specific integrase [Clostridium sp. YIM B02505]|uniref:Site-specific integrase n=1 Tax=Clostridium yunnanense TaxID=2800325 RepID=A0ABS1EQ84_9CLOT|nr:site-specific integrase [Clostridium yunnanense]MBK1811567.1 site-specific integrase [Clostridium yunnanense]
MAREPKTNYEKNGVKYYRVTVTLGRDCNGKLIRKEFYGKNKKDAEEKKDQYLNGINEGLNIDFSNVILGNLMRSWLFEIVRISSNIKPASFSRYEGVFRNYIENSLIYNIKLSDLKSIQIQRYYNNLKSIGKSSNSIKYLNKLLKQFFNYCVDEGYMLKNPCSGKRIVIPSDEIVGPQDEEVEYFTDEEVKILVDGLSKHSLKHIILINLGTGMRRGELLALQWDDINFQSKEICIKRSLSKTYLIDEDGSRKKQTIIQTPKNSHSIRTIPFPESLLPLFKELEIKQKKDKLAAGELYVNSDYIFTTAIGNLIDVGNLYNSYASLLKKLNIKHKKFHALRHTYATKLFEQGIPLKTVSQLLGHSNIEITANIYTHVIPKQKVDAVEKLNYMFKSL